MFNFSAQPAATSTGFSFGTTPQTSAAPATSTAGGGAAPFGGFNFGTATTTTAAAPTFTLGAAATPAPATSTPFSFSQPQTTPTFSFGGTTTAPATGLFGTSTTTTPSFAPSTTTSFAFGQQPTTGFLGATGTSTLGGGQPQAAAQSAMMPVSSLPPQLQNYVLSVDKLIEQHTSEKRKLDTENLDPAIDEITRKITAIEQSASVARASVDDVLGKLNHVKSGVSVLRDKTEEASVVVHRLGHSADTWYTPESSHGPLPSKFFTELVRQASEEVVELRQRIHDIHSLLTRVPGNTVSGNSFVAGSAAVPGQNMSTEELQKVLRLHYEMIIATSARVAALHSFMEEQRLAHSAQAQGFTQNRKPKTPYPWRGAPTPVTRTATAATATATPTTVTNPFASTASTATATTTTPAFSLGGTFGAAPSTPGSGLFGTAPTTPTASQFSAAPSTPGFGVSAFQPTATTQFATPQPTSSKTKKKRP